MFEQYPENLLIRLEFANSLTSHFYFYNQNKFVTFYRNTGNYRLPVNIKLYIKSLSEPEFNEDPRRISGFATI